MTLSFGAAAVRVSLLLILACSVPSAVWAQGRGRGGGGADPAVTVSLGAVTLSAELKTQIRTYYSSRPAAAPEALPPGIRRNLERGKPLPPGIARRTPPPELTSRVAVREGYELVEVGLDVFLVEVATNVIHDVLMDVIR